MKSFSIISTIVLLSSLVNAQTCDVFKVSSKDQQTQQIRIGNGFAYTSQTVVVNDHTLAADAENVQIQNANRVWAASVLKRDFHTDLAVLVVKGASFKPCILKNLASDNLLVMGYDQKDTQISSVPALIKTDASSKLMVPGIKKSLEIVASGQSELRSSQSGSIVLEAQYVVGMVTQKTNEGTALAIAAQDLDKTARMILENKLPKRNYEVDRRKNIFRFDGLVIPNKNEMGVGGVDPHGLGVDPHGHRGVDPHGHGGLNPFTSNPRAPKPIALEDYDIGAVLATVEDFNLLDKNQPRLAKALREAQVNRVFISSIDGISVKNNFELLQILGECQNCKVDSFWVEVQDPSQVQDKTLKLMGWFAALIVELEKDNKPAEVSKIVQAIQKLNPKLAKMIDDGNSGRMDLNEKAEIQNGWTKIDLQLDQLWHSERTLNILTEIRSELL